MRIVAISILALAALSGCMTVHADLSEEIVRHIARKDGAELSAICSYQGSSFSEGAVACMAEQLMTCDPAGRWTRDGTC